jgi:hypothetical protein
VRAWILLVALAAVTAGCAGMGTGGTETMSPAPRTALEISVWARGTDGPVRLWTLRCPPAGTLPNAARACSRLDALGEDAFKPVPQGVACAQIYGGPQVAEVRGTFRGRRIETRFSREDACRIERWNRHAFLFAAGA